jgi:4-amino-4-deoxy-L-arabinose transferase-like glycosyltransferase
MKRATIRDLLLIAAAVLLLRLPFLNQAVQGDDVYYLAGAQYAQTDPLHPNHARYLFLGQEVTMQGHPHPPLNVWFLALLLAVLKDVREVPFHAAYILFTLAAAFSMYGLARRFTARPLTATFLFLAVPAFVVNGNSFEADLPFLAFWMLSAALFIYAVDAACLRRLTLAAGAMALAALAAYQAVLLVPVLGVYLWLKRRSWRAGWAALCAGPAVLAAWQLFERLSSGAAPVAVMSGYFQTYGLQTLASKGPNALGLTAHLAWMLCPLLALAVFRPSSRASWIIAGLAAVTGAIADPNPLFWASLATGILILAWCVERLKTDRDPDSRFLLLWLLGFFGAALVIFFAGSARYLLPLAAPLALLAVRAAGNLPRWLPGAAAAGHLAFGLALSTVNYQHWDGYRQFAASLRGQVENRRVWINGEWGLRFYFESAGGLPVKQGQAVQPGEMVVSSDLALPIPIVTGGATLVPLAEREIRSLLPLRLIGLNARSGYSTVSLGLRPFDLSRQPIDRIRAWLVQERRPVLSYVEMNAPEAQEQIAGGIYQLEEGRWRWMSGRAALLLKRPEGPCVVQVELYVPAAARARRISIWLDGKPVLEQPLPGPGPYTLRSGALRPEAEVARLEIAVDQTFSAPGDQRALGVVLMGVGFRPVP